LADIERGFRVLNDELTIGLIYHRVPKFIQPNVTICFIALIMQRIILHRLKVARNLMSPQQALQMPATIHRNHAPWYEYQREHIHHLPRSSGNYQVLKTGGRPLSSYNLISYIRAFQ
jgi:hypothetical protein